jgi:hypothetical protein
MFNVGKEGPMQHLLFPSEAKRLSFHWDGQIEHLLYIIEVVLKGIVAKANY